MSDLQMIGHLDIKGHDAIKRVYSPEGIAPTLTTCGGGYREVKILDLSKFRVRKLTPTEYGRLQAFPMNNWEQVVSDSQAYKQFGNAVTVSVVTAIAERLRGCLESDEEITEEEQKTPQESAEEATAVQFRPLSDYTEAELLAELMRRQAANG